MNAEEKPTVGATQGQPATVKAEQFVYGKPKTASTKEYVVIGASAGITQQETESYVEKASIGAGSATGLSEWKGAYGLFPAGTGQEKVVAVHYGPGYDPGGSRAVQQHFHVFTYEDLEHAGSDFVGLFSGLPKEEKTYEKEDVEFPPDNVPVCLSQDKHRETWDWMMGKAGTDLLQRLLEGLFQATKMTIVVGDMGLEDRLRLLQGLLLLLPRDIRGSVSAVTEAFDLAKCKANIAIVSERKTTRAGEAAYKWTPQSGLQVLDTPKGNPSPFPKQAAEVLRTLPKEEYLRLLGRAKFPPTPNTPQERFDKIKEIGLPAFEAYLALEDKDDKRLSPLCQHLDYLDSEHATQVARTLLEKALGSPETMETAKASLEKCIGHSGVKPDELVQDTAAALQNEARAPQAQGLVRYLWSRREPTKYHSFTNAVVLAYWEKTRDPDAAMKGLHDLVRSMPGGSQPGLNPEILERLARDCELASPEAVEHLLGIVLDTTSVKASLAKALAIRTFRELLDKKHRQVLAYLNVLTSDKVVSSPQETAAGTMEELQEPALQPSLLELTCRIAPSSPLLKGLIDVLLKKGLQSQDNKGLEERLLRLLGSDIKLASSTVEALAGWATVLGNTDILASLFMRLKDERQAIETWVLRWGLKLLQPMTEANGREDTEEIYELVLDKSVQSGKTISKKALDEYRDRFRAKATAELTRVLDKLKEKNASSATQYRVLLAAGEKWNWPSEFRPHLTSKIPDLLEEASADLAVEEFAQADKWWIANANVAYIADKGLLERVAKAFLARCVKEPPGPERQKALREFFKGRADWISRVTPAVPADATVDMCKEVAQAEIRSFGGPADLQSLVQDMFTGIKEFSGDVMDIIEWLRKLMDALGSEKDSGLLARYIIWLINRMRQGAEFVEGQTSKRALHLAEPQWYTDMATLLSATANELHHNCKLKKDLEEVQNRYEAQARLEVPNSQPSGATRQPEPEQQLADKKAQVQDLRLGYMVLVRMEPDKVQTIFKNSPSRDLLEGRLQNLTQNCNYLLPLLEIKGKIPLRKYPLVGKVIAVVLEECSRIRVAGLKSPEK